MASALRRIGRSLLFVLGLAVVLAGGLHGYHALRLDLFSLAEAQRARIERTRTLRDAAAAFDPDRALRGLGVNPRNGAVVLLDAEVPEASRAGEGGDASRAGRPGFEYEGDDPVSLLPVEGDHRLEAGVLAFSHREGAYLMTRGEFDSGDDPIAEIEIRIRLRRGTSFALGWSGRRLERWSGKVEVLKVDAVPDARFHRYVVSAEPLLRGKAGGRVRTFFLRPSDAEEDEVEIDYVRLVGLRERYARRPVGRAYEERAGELRPVLHAATPQVLSREVRIPDAAPRLDLGLTVLEPRPVRFVADVMRAGEVHGLFAREVRDPGRWEDVSVDLTPWAGRTVTLRLRAGSATPNVAFLSSPRISGTPAVGRSFNGGSLVRLMG